MLAKYFTYRDFKIILNRPELLLVKEFDLIMSDDYNKCKEDKTGKQKLKAFKIFKYIFLLYDMNSPYSEKDFETRQKYSLEDSGLTLKDIISTEVNQASMKYEVLTKSRLSKMLEGAQIAVDKFTLYFHNVDYLDIDIETGKAKYNIKDGIAAVSALDKLVSGLKSLQDQVKNEQDADTTLRGGVEAGLLDG